MMGKFQFTSQCYHFRASPEADDATSKQQWLCVTSSIVSHRMQIHKICSLQIGHSDNGDNCAPQFRQDCLFGIIFNS